MPDGAKNRTHLIHDTMRKELGIMEKERDAHWAKYEFLAQGCATLESAIQVMQERVAGREQGMSLTAATAQVLLDDTDPTTAPVILGPVSLAGCANTSQRLVRMGEVWGTVSCHDAADLLIRKRIARGARGNLVSALQKLMIAREDLWEYVDPRIYRYLPYHNTPDNEPNNESGDATQPGPE